MELSGYDKSKLQSLLIAVTSGIIDSKESCQELATDLTWWRGEIEMAIKDNEMEADALPFPENNFPTMCLCGTELNSKEEKIAHHFQCLGTSVIE